MGGRKRGAGLLVAAIAGAALGGCECGRGAEPRAEERAPAEVPARPAYDPAAVPDTLSIGLLLARAPESGVAALEVIERSGGEWHVETIHDGDSAAFHDAIAYAPPGSPPGILTLGGARAVARLWRRASGGSPDAPRWTSDILWTEDFGGERSTLEDAAVGDLFGDGPAVAIGTGDQGVIATVRRRDGAWSIEQIGRRPGAVIADVAIGDLDGDGTPEVYAAEGPEVGRWVPRTGAERAVAATLGARRATAIAIADADGDGSEELYVASEVDGQGEGGIEIRRWDATTPAEGGSPIARVDGRSVRSFAAGDVNGDGRAELAVATSEGAHLLRAGPSAGDEWRAEPVGDAAALLFADLEGDGHAELYVADDGAGELRRIAWDDAGGAHRSVVHARAGQAPGRTSSLATFPRALLGTR